MVFVTFLARAIRDGWQCWSQKEPTLSLLALGLTSGLMGHAIHMQGDIFNSRPYVQLVFVMCALLAVMPTLIHATPGAERVR